MQRRPGGAPGRRRSQAEANGDAEQVRVHDFPLPHLGRVNPYGIYDQAANAGWVQVGIEHDTAAFGVASIRHWWLGRRRGRSPEAGQLVRNTHG